MTHVTGSSSVNGSSMTNKTSTVFNIATEAGVVALLRTIHRSSIKQKTKNQLRDLIFSLKRNDNKSHQGAIHALNEAGFTAVYDEAAGVTTKLDVEPPVTLKETAPPPAVGGGIGHVRAKPQFAVGATAALKPVTSESKSEPESTTSPAVVAPPAPVDTVKSPAPTAEEVTEQPAAETTADTAPVSTTEPVAESPSTTGTDGDPMTRIKEIKRLINEKVGNPITLISADNQVGREYMNALLAAMKVVNGGRPNEVTAAMERLEQAFKAAIAVAENAPPPMTDTDRFMQTNQPPATTAQPAPPAAPEPAAQTSVPTTEPPSPPPPVEPVVAPPPAPAPVEPPTPVEPAPVAESADAPTSISGGNPVKINVSPTSADVAARASQTFAANLEPVAAPTPPAPQTPPPAQADPVPIVSKLSSVGGAQTSVPAAPSLATPAAPPTPVAVPPSVTPADATVPMAPTPPVEGSARLMSVAKEEQLQNLMRQNQINDVEQQKAAEQAQRANADPLTLPEVTAGLKQLLSEWSLFKGSGFFGTGPSGPDHPLYKEMAQLTMAAVIAGRFEGATPEVKQSVTDYMNGWRYEEGIIHEHTETFEHYLRRVIRHVLDKKAGVAPTATQ